MNSDEALPGTSTSGQYEYRAVRFHADDRPDDFNSEMNQIGQDGWMMVGTGPVNEFGTFTIFFMRRKEVG